MPYTYDAALYVKDVISNRGKNVQVYIVEDLLHIIDVVQAEYPSTDRSLIQIWDSDHR